MTDTMTDPSPDLTAESADASTASIGPFRKLFFGGAAVGLALVAAAILLEVGLWIVAPVAFHEWVLWEPEGHITGRMVPGQVVSNAEGHEIRINRHGFRGPDYTFEKPDGTLRILAHGGSSTFCFKAAGREKTWPAVVERTLSERLNMPVEVINLGLPGFTTFTSKVNYLCYGRAYDPDAIIVYHTFNDMSLMRKRETLPYSHSRPARNRPWWMQVGRATQLGRRLRHVVFAMSKREMDIMTRQTGTGEDFDRPLATPALEWARQNWADIVAMARADGVLPIVCSQASLAGPENWEEPTIHDQMAQGVWARGFTVRAAVETWQRINGAIADVAGSADAIYVDGYGAVPHDLEHVRDNVHLHDKGSAALAKEIVRVLLEDARFQALAEKVRNENR